MVPSSNLRCIWLLWLVNLCLFGGPLVAQPLPPKAAGGDGATTQVDTAVPPVARVDPAAKPPLTPEQKRRVVVATSVVIVGILAVLLLLLLWMVWWSRRTHRLLREPLPAANRGDELWYLKAKRPPSQAAGQPNSELPPPPPSA